MPADVQLNHHVWIRLAFGIRSIVYNLFHISREQPVEPTFWPQNGSQRANQISNMTAASFFMEFEDHF